MTWDKLVATTLTGIRNYRDLNYLKTSKIALSEANKQLRENENRTLFDSATNAILVIEGEKFVNCNHQALSIFNCTKEQIIGKTLYDFSVTTQNTAEKITDLLDKALNEEHLFEWKCLKYDGIPFDAEINMSSFKLKDKNYLHIIIHDIAERKQVEADRIRLAQEREAKEVALRMNQEIETKNKELEIALQQLKDAQVQLVESEKMASLGSLVAGVAHEINTPIGVGLIAASTLVAETSTANTAYKNKQLKGSELKEFFANVIKPSFRTSTSKKLIY